MLPGSETLRERGTLATLASNSATLGRKGGRGALDNPVSAVYIKSLRTGTRRRRLGEERKEGAEK